MAKNSGYTAILGDSTEYSGRLNFEGTVRIDGRFTGDIDSEGKLVLGKSAVFDGTIKVNELVVHGTLNGEVIVTGRTILHETAKVTANVATNRLIMEEGAELQGQLQMGKVEKNNFHQGNISKLNSKEKPVLEEKSVEQ